MFQNLLMITVVDVLEVFPSLPDKVFNNTSFASITNVNFMCLPHRFMCTALPWTAWEAPTGDIARYTTAWRLSTRTQLRIPNNILSRIRTSPTHHGQAVLWIMRAWCDCDYIGYWPNDSKEILHCWVCWESILNTLGYIYVGISKSMWSNWFCYTCITVAVLPVAVRNSMGREFANRLDSERCVSFRPLHESSWLDYYYPSTISYNGKPRDCRVD